MCVEEKGGVMEKRGGWIWRERIRGGRVEGIIWGVGRGVVVIGGR